MCVWYQIPLYGNKMLLYIPGMISVPTCAPLHPAKTDLNEGDAFNISLLSPQKEWFANLLAFLVEESLKLFLLWSLLIQLHITKFHRFLETL